MSTLIKDSILVASTKIISLVLGLVSSIFFVRLLGEDGKGDLTIIEVGVGLFFLATTFNANISIVHFVARKKMDLGKLLGFIISLLLVSVSLSLVIILILQFFGVAGFVLPDSNPTMYLPLVIILLIINEVKEFLSAFLRGIKSFEDLYRSTMVYAIFRVILFSSLYMAFIYGDITFSPQTLIGFHLLTILVITLSIYRFYRKNFLIKPDFSFTYAEVKPFVLFSIVGLLTAILNFLSLKMDIWFVESFEGTSQLGFYAVALGLGEMVSQVPASLRTVLLPYLSGASSKKEQVNTLAFFSRLTCTSTLIISVVLFFTASYLLPMMYGSRFLPSVAPFKIILFAMVIFGFKAIFVIYNVATDRQRFNVWSNLVGILSLIPLCMFLIPSHGIVGAAYAVLLSYAFSALFIFGNVILTKKLPMQNYFFVSVGDVKSVQLYLKERLLKKNQDN